MNLYDLIAKIESAGNQWAMRFEPHVYERSLKATSARVSDVIAHAARLNKCSNATARVIYSMSWGLYQIMGFNLYGPLHMGQAVGPYLADIPAQRGAFQRFCAMNSIWVAGDVPLGDDQWMTRFARLYNGPGNPVEYVRRMREAGGYRG